MIGRGYGRIIHFSLQSRERQRDRLGLRGVEGLTQTFAAQLKQLSVDVKINAVEPGGIGAPIWCRDRSA
jgi:hypothetical protein